MNIMTPQNLNIADDDTPETENPALKRLMDQWEQKLSKNARRAGRVGGLGMVAVSLAACNDSNSGSSSSDDDGGTTPVPDGGIFSLVAGGLQLAGNFDPALFAGGVIPAGVLIGDPSVLTLSTRSNVQGEGLPAEGDDLVLATSGSFLGAEVNLGDGDDTIFINVAGNTLSGLVTNVETIELSNVANTLAGVSVVNLSNVLDVEKVVINEVTAAGDNLQVANIRNTAEIELQGNFNNTVNIDFLNATGPLNLTLNDAFVNAGNLNIAQDFTAVNITSAGDGTLNSIDAGALSAAGNLQSLAIDGEVDFEVINGAINFRPNTTGVIDASGFTGDNLSLTVNAQNDIEFTGSAADDALTVTTAGAAVGPDAEITLNADFGAGDNTLTVNGGGFQAAFVTPDSSITSDGDLTLLIGAGANIDMSQPDANGDLLDLSAVTNVQIQGAFATLTLTAEQVAQIGIENFETPDFGNATGQLNITGVDGSPLDLSDIDVGTLVNLTTVLGDVTLDPTTVLGNANAGVGSVTVNNRGEDSTVTMSADQFQQLGGIGVVGALGGTGSNNSATGQPYTTGLVLTDLDADTAYNLAGVTTTTADVQLSGFTAEDDFALTAPGGGTQLTVGIEGAVDLTEATAPLPGGGNVTYVVADGATLALTPAQAGALGNSLEFEGQANLDIGGTNTFFTLDTTDAGDLSAVSINFVGDGGATLNVTGENDVTLKSVNAGPDITGTVTVINNLDPGATLDITGGSPALELDENVTILNVNAGNNNTTLIGTDPAEPGIVSSTLTAINANTFGLPDAVINLGVLSVTSPALTVTGTGPGTTSVELGEVPAGAAWTFSNVELVINDVAEFGAGATINLAGGVTLAGDAAIADIVPFLAPGSQVPIDSNSTPADINTILGPLGANEATINVTDMSNDQLVAVSNNSLKVDEINGDLALNAGLSVFQINNLSGLYSQGVDDELTIDAAGMDTAQKQASANAVETNTTVVNLTLDENDTAGVISDLLPETADGSTTVNADGMVSDPSNDQLGALSDNIGKVQVINDMTLTSDTDPGEMTNLLGRASETVTVDADGMDNPDFAAIVQQITKVATVENLDVTAGSPAEDFEVSALLELAVDATVDAAGMSDARLSIVAENIDNIADDGISNLTVTAEQTAAEITALLGKADSDPDPTAEADLSGMDADQVAAVVASADRVDSLTVGQNATSTVTLAELADLEAANLTPIIAQAAGSDEDTGGSITIVAEADGTLDLGLVTAGAFSAPGDENGGTLTLQIEDGVSLSLENGPVNSENLSVTGAGTLIVTEDLNLNGLNLSVGSDVTIELAAADPGITLTLGAEQVSTLKADGVTIDKAAATAPAVEGQIEARGGQNDDNPGEPQDLSGLDLSIVDVLVLEEPDFTILPSSATALPAQVGFDDGNFGPEVLVPEDTDWSAYTGNFAQDVNVAPDATVTLSAETVTQMENNAGGGSFVEGQDASADGETGGSIIVTALENGEVYDLSGTLTPGGDGGFTADAGTFEVSISSDVTLEAGTILPTTADVTIDTGATLTVNGGTAQADGSNSYEGTGTLEFIGLDTNTVTADGDARFNTFTFEDSDANVTINGFEAENAVVLPNGDIVSGTNGRFLFDGEAETLGTMSLDLSSFSTTGTGFDTIPDGTTATDLDGVGVIVVDDGSDPTNLDFSGANNGDGAQLFFAYENGSDTEVQYWDDAGGNGDGVVDAGETSLVATLNSTDTDQLGSENFTV